MKRLGSTAEAKNLGHPQLFCPMLPMLQICHTMPSIRNEVKFWIILNTDL